jgi:hypothetical protein
MFYGIIIIILLIICLILSISLLIFIKKNVFLSEKEREFIFFVFEIYEKFSDDLGIQSKDQHEKLVNELNKIKKKLK